VNFEVSENRCFLTGWHPQAIIFVNSFKNLQKIGQQLKLDYGIVKFRGLMKISTIFFFERDVKKIKQEYPENSATRWEKLKEYAEKNDVPVPIAKRPTVKPNEPATSALDYFYDSKFYALESAIALYVDRRRMLWVGIGTFLLTKIIDWLSHNSATCIQNIFLK
jgi:hypothetical protein